MDKKLESLLRENTSEKDVKNYVNKNLSQSDKEKISAVLSDKQKLNEILSSPFAQELMKKFRK